MLAILSRENRERNGLSREVEELGCPAECQSRSLTPDAPVIGAGLDVHTLILPDFSGKINLRKYSLANTGEIECILLHPMHLRGSTHRRLGQALNKACPRMLVSGEL